jgi:putative hydrolase of the HAD superfamily
MNLHHGPNTLGEAGTVKPDSILFDLDNTLYSARFGLEQNVSRRATEYAAAYLGLTEEEARAARRAGVIKSGYGTTLEWLLEEKGLDPSLIDDYFAYIHPEDEADGLIPDPLLRPFLLSLSQSYALGILTNASPGHIDRILNKLEIADLFPSIFDIRSNGLKGKPHPGVFYRALEGLGTSPGRCVFIDDVDRNVESYRNLGGVGVYFDEFDKKPGFPPPRITRLGELGELLK